MQRCCEQHVNMHVTKSCVRTPPDPVTSDNIICININKGKIQFSLYQFMKTYEGAQVSSQSHSPGKQRPAPRGKEAAGPQSRFGRREVEINLLPLSGNEP